MIYGASIVGFLLFEPKGLVEIWRRLMTYFQLWPYARERLGGGSGG
jgi:branched-chain amino acid transport system permease protein